MFYIMYLTGLCSRRHWPEPLYEVYRTRHGWHCTVRVNNREYTTDAALPSAETARNAAATQAYMICRNFSVNDGMYPGQRQGQGGVVQGLPVAIGTGRRGTCGSRGSADGFASVVVVGRGDSPSPGSGGLGSGGSSPRSSDSGFEERSRRSSKSEGGGLCFCGRGSVRAYERCGPCLREGGWRI